jgi:hypothetical protein
MARWLRQSAEQGSDTGFLAQPLSISDTASIIYDVTILGATHRLSEHCANENIVYTYTHIDHRYG